MTFHFNVLMKKTSGDLTTFDSLVKFPRAIAIEVDAIRAAGEQSPIHMTAVRCVGDDRYLKEHVQIVNQVISKNRLYDENDLN